AWIEILACLGAIKELGCRSPHGERGLKLCDQIQEELNRKSLPSRGAWIEIKASLSRCTHRLSLPSRGAWIEIQVCKYGRNRSMSLPSRGAWIEINCLREQVQRIRGRSPHGERGLK